jgi:glycylpeptide N-tetradecanoyltransferase
MPRDGVIDTYVIESPTEKGKITDMISFYHLPSTIIGHIKYKTLRAVYSFYNVATSVPLTDLMKDCLIVAKQLNADVVNALDLMENGTFLEKLKFGHGDGYLQYYLYNWATPEMTNKELGLVLL